MTDTEMRQLIGEFATLLVVLGRVRALHVRSDDGPYCSECGPAYHTICCDEPAWPCPTAEALDSIPPPSSAPAAAVALLREHRWDPRALGCACGWSQSKVLPRAYAQHNHPAHVADVLRQAGLFG